MWVYRLAVDISEQYYNHDRERLGPWSSANALLRCTALPINLKASSPRTQPRPIAGPFLSLVISKVGELLEVPAVCAFRISCGAPMHCNLHCNVLCGAASKFKFLRAGPMCHSMSRVDCCMCSHASVRLKFKCSFHILYCPHTCLHPEGLGIGASPYLNAEGRSHQKLSK